MLNVEGMDEKAHRAFDQKLLALTPMEMADARRRAQAEHARRIAEGPRQAPVQAPSWFTGSNAGWVGQETS